MIQLRRLLTAALLATLAGCATPVKVPEGDGIPETVDREQALALEAAGDYAAASRQYLGLARQEQQPEPRNALLLRAGELLLRAGEIDNVIWNASGLGFSNSPQAAVGYMDYLVTIGGGTAAYMGVGKGFGYGVHASYLSSDTYAKTALDDQVGEMGNTFDYGEVVLGMSGGIRLRSATN